MLESWLFYRPMMADHGGLSLRLIIDEVDKVETELKELSRTQQEEEAAVQLLKQMLENEDREIQQVRKINCIQMSFYLPVYRIVA